jgi:hypothetical protein
MLLLPSGDARKEPCCRWTWSVAVAMAENLLAPGPVCRDGKRGARSRPRPSWRGDLDCRVGNPGSVGVI